MGRPLVAGLNRRRGVRGSRHPDRRHAPDCLGWGCVGPAPAAVPALLFDVLLLISAVVLVLRSTSENDDVWALCLRALAAAAVITVVVGDHGLPLCIGLLALAVWLPSANRAEQQQIEPRPTTSTVGLARRRP